MSIKYLKTKILEGNKNIDWVYQKFRGSKNLMGSKLSRVCQKFVGSRKSHGFKKFKDLTKILGVQENFMGSKNFRGSTKYHGFEKFRGSTKSHGFKKAECLTNQKMLFWCKKAIIKVNDFIGIEP